MKHLDVTIEVLLNSLILAFVAAMIRVLFSKVDSYKDTISIFLGSILLGVTIGYTMNDFENIRKYLKVIIVLFSIFGKELFEWLKTIASDPGKNMDLILKLFSSIKITLGNKKEKDDVN